MPNLALRHKKKMSPFRKMALGTWQNAGDPSIYGSITLRMEPAERYIARFRAATGVRLTMSHLMGKAVAAALQAVPDANAIQRLGRIYLRDQIAIFFQVVMEDPATGQIDLSGAVVQDADKKSLVEIAGELEERAARVRSGRDQKDAARGAFRRVPGFAVGPMLRAITFFTHTLNLDLQRLGLPKDPFGSVMITNIGTLGLEEAYAPLVPYARIPMLVAMGAVRDAPVVEDGRVIAGRVMTVGATMDHRILDGAHAAIMVRTVRAWMEDPDRHFDPLPE